MTHPKTEYRSYLLRLWRSSEQEPWHAMLEQVGTQQRRAFADLASLMEFLQVEQIEPAKKFTQKNNS